MLALLLCWALLIMLAYITTQALVHAQVLLWSHCHCKNVLPGHCTDCCNANHITAPDIPVHLYERSIVWFLRGVRNSDYKAAVLHYMLCCFILTPSHLHALQMFDTDTEESRPTQDHFLSIADVSCYYVACMYTVYTHVSTL